MVVVDMVTGEVRYEDPVPEGAVPVEEPYRGPPVVYYCEPRLAVRIVTEETPPLVWWEEK